MGQLFGNDEPVRNVTAQSPINIQRDGDSLTIWTDLVPSIAARLTERVTDTIDSQGIARTAYRWKKVKTYPGGQFIDADDGVAGFQLGSTPPQWPAFPADKNAAVNADPSTGDVVILYPGWRDGRDALSQNYGLEWYFFPGQAKPMGMPFNTTLSPVSIFLPNDTWTQIGPGVALNPNGTDQWYGPGVYIAQFSFSVGYATYAASFYNVRFVARINKSGAPDVTVIGPTPEFFILGKSLTNIPAYTSEGYSTEVTYYFQLPPAQLQQYLYLEVKAVFSGGQSATNGVGNTSSVNVLKLRGP